MAAVGVARLRRRSGPDEDNKRTTTRWADEEDGCKEGGNGKGSVTAREEDLKDDDELR